MIKPPRHFRTIRVRMTLLFVTVFTILLLIFSSFLYNAFKESSQNEFDGALYNHAVDVANSLDFDVFGSLSLDARSIYDQEKIRPFQLGRSVLQIRRLDGSTLFRSETGRAELPFTEADYLRIQELGFNYRNIEWDRMPLHLYSPRIICLPGWSIPGILTGHPVLVRWALLLLRVAPKGDFKR